jgi:hypothetical protein
MPAEHALAAARHLLPGGQYYAVSADGSWSSKGAGELTWQAGNTMETLANLAHGLNSSAPGADANSLLKEVRRVFSEAFDATSGVPRYYDHFDDFGWWALGLLRGAMLLGGNASQTDDYVAMATNIWELYRQHAWDNSTCGGGVFWGPVPPATPGYKNAITNELFLALSASLHLATGRPEPLSWALKEWAWFEGSGLINAHGTINDGLTDHCRNNNQTTWTYNQGVVLGGLSALYKATKNATLLRQADSIARSAIGTLAPGGILREPCESAGQGGCSANDKIFRGVFVRHLHYLSLVARPDDAAFYRCFLRANAASAIAKDSTSDARYGELWAGPLDLSKLDAITQTAALDLLVADAFPTPRPAPPLPPSPVACAPVGAWTRPGYHCKTTPPWRPLALAVQRATEGVWRRSLADCQAACLADPTCAFFTFDGERLAHTLGGGRGGAEPERSPNSSWCWSHAGDDCTVDMTGCGGRSTCRYVSGARACAP